MLERQHERVRRVREEAETAFRDGKTVDALRLLEAFEPGDLVAEALKTFTEAAALVASAEQAVASAPAPRRAEALEALQAGPPTLVGPALVRLRELHVQRSLAETHEGAVNDAIASARVRVEHVDSDRALDSLERFTPRDPRILDVLAELRARRASLEEERARVEARRTIAEARTSFERGDRARALALLTAFAPPAK